MALAKSHTLSPRKSNRRLAVPSASVRATNAPRAAPDAPFRPIAQRWPVAVLAALTWVLTLPLFEPFSWWPLGFVALAPWLLAVCGARPTRWVYFVSYGLGVAFFLIQLRWMWVVTPAGYVAGSFYSGFFFLLAAWLVRHASSYRGLSIVWCFPVVWVMTELLRARGPLTFPWFLLGHGQIHLRPMIQIADVTGVYGISFVLAAVTGLLVAAVLGVWNQKSAAGNQSVRVGRGAWVHGLLVAALVAGTLLYGRYRLSFDGLTPGPRIAVLQGDFLLEAVRGPQPVSEAEKVETYVTLMNRASRHEPDMIVLPETPWNMLLNRQHREIDAISKMYHEEFIRRANLFDTYLVVGSLSVEPQPPGGDLTELRFNSAYVYAPDGGEPRRYDKIHLVPFGEYVPFRHTPGLFWLHRFLNDGPFNPWGRGGVEYSLTAGREFTTFTMRTRPPDSMEACFGITICYEDVIPGVFRRFVVDRLGRKRVDFMLNISNDGWFGRGAQQPQHLVNCAFRAVENRVAVARAANTGISGFVASDGSWHDVVGENQRHPRAGGIDYRVARIQTDPRATFYSQYGDVAALACTLGGLGILADAFVVGWRRRRDRQVATERPAN